MRAEATSPDKKDMTRTYPYLGRMGSGTVVLFTHPYCGTVVCAYHPHKLGQVETTWMEDGFDVFVGTVTLSNN